MSHKISFFAPNLAGGGAERVISVLARKFAENGYDVDLILAEATGPYLSDMPESVKIINLNSTGVLSSLPKLVKYIKINQPDVLFTSQMHASTIALWAVKIAAVKTRVFVRQPTMLMPSNEKKTWMAKLRLIAEIPATKVVKLIL